jgi:hypothetical protein
MESIGSKNNFSPSAALAFENLFSADKIIGGNPITCKESFSHELKIDTINKSHHLNILLDF